jgi:hypothetical protein
MPPFSERRNGKPGVYAGIPDQAPRPEPDRGRTLIPLTRPYRRIPDHPHGLFVKPSGDKPADKLDFTGPEKMRSTWSAGCRDTETFLRDWVSPSKIQRPKTKATSLLVARNGKAVRVHVGNR